jgi:O-antigen biosynthesis protein
MTHNPSHTQAPSALAEPVSKSLASQSVSGAQARVQIAVVIVNYNVKDFLVQCLSSLRASLTGVESLIVVVDNNSTDGSIDYAAPLFADAPEVEFMRLPENLGFGKANNLGFDRALERGADYVLCLNPDTLISEDTMRVMLEYMAANPRVGLAGCKLLNADGTFQLSCRRGFPTPWASFCKVFGLQALFPRVELFARYNQTFRSENETCMVDAVSGAFMFMRSEVLRAVRGFDEDFFMYGEDLDLCYRIQQAGWNVAYVHTTEVIHYKGESTRRSSLNEVRVFYGAMDIFARKHFGSSRLFLLFLQAGIVLRSLLAYGSHYGRESGLIVWDALAINAAMLLGTYIRFGEWFHFPHYAYPLVVVVVALVGFVSLVAAGEYSSYEKPSVGRVFSGMLMSFFVLSALPYFFKDYAFSRAVSIMLTVFGFVFMAGARLVLNAREQLHSTATRRVLFVGNNHATAELARLLQTSRSDESVAATVAATVAAAVEAVNEAVNIVSIVGIVAADGDAPDTASVVPALPLLGRVAYLRKIIQQSRPTEVIITDATTPRALMIRAIMDAAAETSEKATRPTFRFAREYDEVIAAQVLEDYAGTSPVLQYNLARWQNRALKRMMDIVGAVFLLSIGLPIVFWLSDDARTLLRRLRIVVQGRASLVGLYHWHDKRRETSSGNVSELSESLEPLEIVEHSNNAQDSSHGASGDSFGSSVYRGNHHGKHHVEKLEKQGLGKQGIIGLAHIHSPERLTPRAIENLNEFYSQHYTFWLDIEIVVTYCLHRLFRRHS